jgi:hypothetical protein
MQRSICRIVGACGLIFTFTTAAQTAGGGSGAAAGGGAAASGGARGGVSGAAVPQGSISTAPGSGVTGRPAQSINNATLTGANGQPTLNGATTAQTPVPGTATAAAAGQTQLENQNAVGQPITPTSAANTTASASGIITRSVIPFSSLPASVQATLAAQLPAGAQIGSIVQETTPQGTVFRAQVMQNGVTSEMTLGSAGTSALASVFPTAAAGTLLPLATTGFVTGTPYTFEQLPAGVQGAFTAQANGLPVTNITYTAGANGAGTFRGMANGRPIEIRTAPTQLATTPGATNELRIEDVPKVVRDAVKNSQPYAEVARIRKAESASGALYDITLRSDNGVSTMQVSEDGTIVRENRNVGLALETTPTLVATNDIPKLEFTTLPVAVRDAIETRVDPKKIKLLVLTNVQNKTTYAADYVDSDGLRNRLYVNKEGLVARVETNLFGIMHTGRAVTIDDLPAAARSAIEAKAESSPITRIDLDMRGLTPVYIVSYVRDGETRQMVFTPQGVSMDAVGAPPSASTGESPVSIKGLPAIDEKKD